MASVAGIILAAGKGTRMKSDLPKVLHRVGGETMVGHVVRAMRGAGVDRIIVVIGHGADLVRETLEGVEFAVQTEQKGTGHAVMAAIPILGDWEGTVLVSSGDTPLMTDGALRRLIERQQETGAHSVIATVNKIDPTGYGRILWEGDRYLGIIEEKDATPEQKRLTEVCVSVYAFSGAGLASALPRLNTNNAQGEYYLTDVPLITAESGGKVITELYDDEMLFAGVNDRAQLAEAATVLKRRINRQHMVNGVTIIDPEQTYIGVDVDIAPDAVIYPGTQLEGVTKIGAGAILGPNTRVLDSEIQAGATVQMSVVLYSVIGENAKVGPFSYLRSNAEIGPDVKVGAYVEVKNSSIGAKASLAHLSYIGDATIGARTNIGAGVITANYDGFLKHRTVVGSDAFIGSNSTLIAPVEVGSDAFVAAGTSLSKPVPSGAFAMTRADLTLKEEWVARYRARKQAEKAALKGGATES
jgi:bifunctional UDP-N-acetylglucosamine pyrophosphorylase/glucosamine-1-phosphate N-acetyltransferase